MKVTHRQADPIHDVPDRWNEIKGLRTPIRKITHHVPEERPSSSLVVQDLRKIKNSMQGIHDCGPEEQPPAVGVV